MRQLRTYSSLVLLGVFICVCAAIASAQTSDADAKIRAAIDRVARSAGYEVTDRKRSSDSEVGSLEQRDSKAYQPSSQTIFRLRSLRPWSQETSTYFRYWLIRESYDSEMQAEKRMKEYMTNYTERLATSEMSSHMISKTIIRVGAKRRGRTVYLLVTDGAYTLDGDRKRDVLLDRLVKASGT